MLTIAKIYFSTATETLTCAATSAPIYPGEDMAHVDLAVHHGPRFQFTVSGQVRNRSDEQIMTAIVEHQAKLTTQFSHPTEFQQYLRDQMRADMEKYS